MIFATLGTQPLAFSRFLKEIDSLIEVGHISEKVIVQTGYTKYKSEKFEGHDFFSEEEFSKHIRNASVIITHAGYGSLFNAIKAGKKIIAVARLKKYGEMVDDHQLELVHKLVEEGYIINGTDSLVFAWKQLEDFIPRKYDFEHHIVPNLKSFLDSL